MLSESFENFRAVWQRVSRREEMPAAPTNESLSEPQYGAFCPLPGRFKTCATRFAPEI